MKSQALDSAREEMKMSDQDPVTKVGAKLEIKLNLGNYNNANLTVWIEDRVRPEDGSTSKAADRITGLLDAKLEQWARQFKDE